MGRKRYSGRDSRVNDAELIAEAEHRLAGEVAIEELLAAVHSEVRS